MGRSRSRSPPRHYRDDDRRRGPPPEPSSRDRYRNDRPREDDRRRRDRDRDYERSDSHPDRRGDRNRDRYDDRRRDDRKRSPPRRRSPKREQDDASDRRALVRRNSRSRSGSREPSQPPPNLEPNFKNSGLLAAATKTVQHADGTSTVLKYHEPPEARKPLQSWRLYVFRGEEQTDILHIHRQSAYLIGRDHVVVDIPLDHPSCSKQHAAIQYRSMSVSDEYGGKSVSIKPFIIDLESVNGTFVNGEQIPASRYYELKASDMIKFGLSPKEYVLLHEEVA
ncbi:SMAD/FHA domain-containing protein [Auriculariales sp. MPI-PUGE-AT-0066]|nr:SMAD/FHA domain-containing protein [Auriculariales sp. MPI-PUGE-AT-0066]KAH7106686.1 SMAD/FHA domain-containing protein [Auriculariales sp. MPI-PUGE-AT-0066]